MNQKIKKLIISSLFALFLLAGSRTYAVSGFVLHNQAGNQALVCHDVTCASPTPGIINFQPTDQTVFIDSVTGLTGYVWGDELGWINLNPTGQGVHFADASTGRLTGYGWSQVGGWVNFGVTGVPLFIQPETGEFNGYAWAGGPLGGWIKFTCSSVASCVRTSWRPPVLVQNQPSLGRYDVCLNLPDIQLSIPAGYTVATDGSCVKFVDECPNLLGTQTVVPESYVKDSTGACVPTFVDYCPNIEGNQTSVAAGKIIDQSGNCVDAPKDVCPNISGIQTSYSQCPSGDKCLNLPGFQTKVPESYIAEKNICYLKTLDLCPNIPENQRSIPAGYIVDKNGNCTKPAKDLCANLAGIQEVVPANFYLEKNACIFIDKSEPVHLPSDIGSGEGTPDQTPPPPHSLNLFSKLILFIKAIFSAIFHTINYIFTKLFSLFRR